MKEAGKSRGSPECSAGPGGTCLSEWWPQQAGRGHTGRQSRDTLEAGRQQEEAGAQQAGRGHAGRQSRDTQEEGLQQGLGWQQEEAEQGESSQHTGVQQIGLQHTGVQQAGLHTGRQSRDTQEEGLQDRKSVV